MPCTSEPTNGTPSQSISKPAIPSPSLSDGITPMSAQAAITSGISLWKPINTVCTPPFSERSASSCATGSDVSAVRGFHITVILTVDSYYGVAESRCETFNSVACKKQFPGRNWRIWQSVGRIYHLRALSSIFPRRQPGEKPDCGGVAMHKAKMPRRQQLFQLLVKLQIVSRQH